MTVFYFDGQILGKAEFLNPGGSVKDRIAVKIIEEVFQGKKKFPFFCALCRNLYSSSPILFVILNLDATL